MKNSLRFNPLSQLKDGPMGISIALSPTQGNLAFSKDAITNASFRARKLPGVFEVVSILFVNIYSFSLFSCVLDYLPSSSFTGVGEIGANSTGIELCTYS